MKTKPMVSSKAPDTINVRLNDKLFKQVKSHRYLWEQNY